jgi:D-arabinose 1-dehydrogenase-like Zn-dependent alcohol dehydrogenase
MRKMKAVQVSRAGGDLEVVERDIPETGPGQVRIRVQACGVCHSDLFTKEGLFPGISYPRVPGHEVAGIVDAVGPGVKGWTKGDRVGVGWHGGQDGTCTACRKDPDTPASNRAAPHVRDSLRGGDQRRLIGYVVPRHRKEQIGLAKKTHPAMLRPGHSRK